MTPLPSVEIVCAMLQQEEMQGEVLKELKPYHEASTLLSKGNGDKCGHCGNKGHDKDKSWQIIGYPSWHPKSRRFHRRKDLRKVKRTPN